MADNRIRHVVVLMFENHSFDQMLGCFKDTYSGLDGVDPNNLLSNKDLDGQDFFQRQFPDPVVSPDPRHELKHILNQLANGNGGFVSEYHSEYLEENPDVQRIMDYFGMGDLPALHELAANFTICDHWYSSVPGPTWTNRFFVHSGTSKGLVTMPENITDTKYYWHYDQQTIYDQLRKAGIKWRIYFGDVPQSLVLNCQKNPLNAVHYRLMHSFFDDAQGDEKAFPAYSFIEPNYFKGEQNDDHPPHSTVRAQRLLGQVYNVLRANEELWDSTLLVVLYDEHGGFYDHVPPPAAIPPDQHTDEYAFNQLGVRVPALLISPWVGKGVLTTKFDHTSLLKFVSEKWSLEPLTQRVVEANNFADALLTTKRPPADTPYPVTVPALVATMAAEMVPLGFAHDTSQDELDEPTNDLQNSLMIFAQHLQENELPVEHHLPELAMAGPLNKEKRAKEQVVAFLEKQRAKAMGNLSGE